MEKKLAGPIELFSRSLKIFSSRFLVFIGVYLLAAVFQVLISFFGIGTALFAFLGIGPANIFNGFQNVWLVLVLVIAFSFIVGLVYSWCQIAVLMIIRRQDKEIGVFKAYSLAFKKLFAYFGTIVFSAFVILGGTVILIIPGIIVGLWLALVPMTVVFDDLKGFKAMLASRQYVRGRLGGFIWRLISFGLVMAVISGIISSLKTDLMYQIGVGYFAGVLQLVFNLIAVPFSLIYFSQLFLSLKQTKSVVDTEQSKHLKPAFVFLGILGLVVGLGLPVWIVDRLSQFSIFW